MRLGDAATTYARRGWSVMPVRGKRPLTSHGVHDATTDEDQVVEWWDEHPEAGIALACGTSCGMWVLDIDAGKGGPESLAELEERFGPLPRTRRARTGGGGAHLFWRLPQGASPPRNAVNLRVDGRKAQGLDVRSNGGYVVLPPSPHPAGTRYEWLDAIDAVEAPAWLWRLVSGETERPATLLDAARPAEGASRAPQGAPPDTTTVEQRFAAEALRGACGDIREAGRGAGAHGVLFAKARKIGGYVGADLLDAAEARAALIEAAVAAGKGLREVERAVDQGLELGAQKPIRPVVKNTGPMDRDAALAWWDANPSASSAEAAMATGVPAATLRRWRPSETVRGEQVPPSRREQAPSRGEQAPPRREQVPPAHREQGPSRREQAPPQREQGPSWNEQAPPAHGEQAPSRREQGPPDRSERAPPRREQAPPAHRGEAPAHRQSDTISDADGPDGPVAVLQAIRDEVVFLDEREAKVQKLASLLEGDFVQQLADVRRVEPSAGVAELTMLRSAFPGAARLIDQLERLLLAALREVARAADQETRYEADSDLEDDDRPTIVIRTAMRGVIDEAIAALADRETAIYQRGGTLVQVCRDGRDIEEVECDPETPTIRELRPTRLQELMSSSARWVRARRTAAGTLHDPTVPIDWAVRGVLERGSWPFHALRGVSEIPIFRPDGSVHDTPGYDPVTRYWYEPAPDLRVNLKVPTTIDYARDAWEKLKEPFADFPFADEHHLSAAVAALLTLVARPGIGGPCPLFAVQATTPGSGKSLLVDLVHIVTTGRPIARSAHVEAEEEQEKRITSIVLAGLPAVLIDNVVGTFGGRAMDAAITGTQWMGRSLGSNDLVNLPLRCTWFVTGNNMSLRGDMARRVLPIQLEPEEERPEHRTGFLHPDIKAWVARHRSELLTHAFTLLRAGMARGAKPEKTFGSFEEWSDIVRRALVWVGAPDPMDGVAQMAASSDERRNLVAGLLAEMHKRWSWAVKTSELVDAADADDGEDLRDILTELAGDRGGKINPKTLGYVLRQAKGRIYGGLRLNQGAGAHNNVVRWKVERVSR